jgi:hypothetical protein
MMEQHFWKIKTIVSGVMMTFGCLGLVVGAAAVSFAIFFSVKTQVQKPTPTLEMHAGKKFSQKLPIPVIGEPMAIVFDNTVAKEMPKLGLDERKASLANSEPLQFAIDLSGGKTDSDGKPISTTGKTSFDIERPHLERSSSKTRWRLADDDTAKFAKFYGEFVTKQPPDIQAADNEDRAGIGYHYAWVGFIWGIILVGLAIVLRRFDPDKY